MTFNIQHGIDATSRYNLQRAIDAIAQIRPDVVALQEVTRNHPYYSCDDQPARIASGVSAATGQAWDVVYQQEWFTPDVSCQKSGRGTAAESEGLAILTPRSMSGPTTMSLTDSRIGLEVAIRDAYSLPIVATHLTSGTTSNSTRSQQIDRLTAWAAGFGEPRVVLGDFNAAPEYPELRPMFSSYHDAWTDAVGAGHAMGSAISHGSTRIDYVFFKPGNGLTLESAETIDTRSLLGVRASDHEPVVATFVVR